QAIPTGGLLYVQAIGWQASNAVEKPMERLQCSRVARNCNTKGETLTHTASAFSKMETTAQCASDISRQVKAQLEGAPNALIVFASPTLELQELLSDIQAQCN